MRFISGRLIPAIAALVFVALALVAPAPQAGTATPEKRFDTLELTLQSRILDEERTLRIRLPRGYAEGTIDYPVLWLLDAEWHFELATADVELLSECTYIQPHPIPPLIVVGVVNTDRNRDYTPTHSPQQAGMSFPTSGGAERYRRFLTEEAIPAIEERFRAAPFRILAGWSLGGLFTIDTMLKPDSSFDSYLAISPSLWWDDGWVLRELVSGHFDGEAGDDEQLIVTLGSVELDRESMVARATNAFTDHVAENPRAGLAVERVTLEGLGHNYSPKMAFFMGLATVFADLTAPPETLEQGLPAVDAYHAALAARYHFDIPVPENVYGKLGWQLFEQERREESRAVFKAWVERHEMSSVAWASLASFYRETSRKDLALPLLSKAIELEERSENPRASFIRDLRRDVDALQAGE